MNCVHHAMPEPKRPLTAVTFNNDEVAEALRDYALRMGLQMPTGEMHWSIDHLRETHLCIERSEGQEVWPPEAVADGG